MCTCMHLLILTKYVRLHCMGVFRYMYVYVCISATITQYMYSHPHSPFIFRYMYVGICMYQYCYYTVYVQCTLILTHHNPL